MRVCFLVNVKHFCSGKIALFQNLAGDVLKSIGLFNWKKCIEYNLIDDVAKNESYRKLIEVCFLKGEIDCLSDTCSVKPVWLNPSISRRLLFYSLRTETGKKRSMLF